LRSLTRLPDTYDIVIDILEKPVGWIVDLLSSFMQNIEAKYFNNLRLSDVSEFQGFVGLDRTTQFANIPNVNFLFHFNHRYRAMTLWAAFKTFPM
jgi:hypothetical protein